MKKLSILLILSVFTVNNSLAEKRENRLKKENKKKIVKKHKQKDVTCTSPSWQTPEQCKAEEGNWIDDKEASCKVAHRWLGDKPSDEHICCAGCTDDAMEEMGSD